ncbi:MAG: tRNA(Ile2) 2-agmatinylcytidine synthetase, partial [Halobacteria archaeon]|nr:tRNA(Ile2) 2-agmatinylcytidine synthetase [Halobacteria archaeon]
MCTTYLATLVAESVSDFATVEERVLTRLNPNIPYKTRGNACLSLHVDTDEPERVKS